MSLAYLRTYSYFSLQESLVSPQDLARLAKNNGIQALGLTDYQYLSGAIEFYEACVQYNIKSIFGLEVDFTYNGQSGRITLLAKNKKGWANLSRISSKSLVENCPIDLNTLHTYKDGLICLLGGIKGIFRKLYSISTVDTKLPQRLIAEIKDVFNQDCFFEIQRYSNGPLSNEPIMIDLARQAQIPLVATQTIHYQNPKDHSLFITISAIRQNQPISQLKRRFHSNYQFHFPTKADFLHRYIDLPEAITNLNEIVDRCNFTLPIGQTHFPTFPTPSELSQTDYLKKRAYEGAKRIYQRITPEIENRLEHELSIIGVIRW